MTREALIERGLTPCRQCGEMNNSGFCSKFCRETFEQEALRTAVRETPHTPEPLHWIEMGMLEIALANRLAQLGRFDYKIEVDPSSGFTVRPDGKGCFVGAKEAKFSWGYRHLDRRDAERAADRNLLDQFLLDTVVSPTGDDPKPLPKRFPADATKDERLHWIWQLRVVRGMTLAEAGEQLGVSKERVRQLQVTAERLGRTEALKHAHYITGPIPPPRALLPKPEPLPDVVWINTTLTTVEARQIAKEYCWRLSHGLHRLPIGVSIQLTNGKVQAGAPSYNGVYASKASIHTEKPLSREESAYASRLLKTIRSNRLRENPKDAHLTHVEHYERLRDPETD